MKRFTDKITENIELSGEDRLGRDVFLIVSSNETYFINHQHITFTSDPISFDNYWLHIKRFSQITQEEVGGYSYGTEEEALKYVTMLNTGNYEYSWKTTIGKPDDSHTKPVKYLHAGDKSHNWMESAVEVEGWKIVPFFIGAYRTDI